MLFVVDHVVSYRTFNALVEGFGAFASVTAVTSALRAYLAAAAYPGQWSDTGMSEAIGEGVNKGLIIGVPIGLVFMAVVMLDSYNHIPLS
jgi:hypothetical protein